MPNRFGREVAEQICADISKAPINARETSLLVTVSCGVATRFDGVTEGYDLMHRAEKALHFVKKAGGMYVSRRINPAVATGRASETLRRLSCTNGFSADPEAFAGEVDTGSQSWSTEGIFG